MMDLVFQEKWFVQILLVSIRGPGYSTECPQKNWTLFGAIVGLADKLTNIAPKSVQVFWDILYDVLEKIVKTFWIFIHYFCHYYIYNRQFVFTASTPLIGASAVARAVPDLPTEWYSSQGPQCTLFESCVLQIMPTQNIRTHCILYENIWVS